MPTFATVNDFTLAFSEQEAIDLAAFVGDTARLTRALEAAEGEVRSYLAGRYQLPTEPALAGRALKQAVLDIARYRLQDARPLEAASLRYQDAMRWCKDVAKGMASVMDASGNPLPAAIAPEQTASAIIATGSSGLSAFGASFDNRYGAGQVFAGVAP